MHAERTLCGERHSAVSIWSNLRVILHQNYSEARARHHHRYANHLVAPFFVGLWVRVNSELGNKILHDTEEAIPLEEVGLYELLESGGAERSPCWIDVHHKFILFPRGERNSEFH